MDAILQDIRFGVRMLGKDRGFAITAILTLALCLGANAAIFAIVNAVLLRPLPVPDADRILLMSNQYPKQGLAGNTSFTPDYVDRRRDLTVFEEQAMFTTVSLTVDIDGLAERLRTMLVTPSWFRLVRVAPILGRGFHDDDAQPGNVVYDRDGQRVVIPSGQTVVLSYAIWQQLFGGDPAALGRELMISGRPHTVVGVMPRGFLFVNPDVRLWVPMVFTDEMLATRHGGLGSYHIGRLAEGATADQVRAQLAAIDVANMDRFPQWREFMVNAGYFTRVERLKDMVVRDVRTTLYLLWGSAAFVLLLGAANVINLVLARSSSRGTELATRVALGAGRLRVVRQLITESLIVAVLGGAVGLLFGLWLIDALLYVGGERLPRAGEVRLDWAVTAFALAVSLGVGVLIGLLGSGILLNANIRELLNEQGRSWTSGRGARAVRHALVVAQVSLACVLLTGSLLLLVSFRRTLAVDAGFSGRDIVTAATSLNASYPGDGELRTFMTRALAAFRAIPGVSAVGATNTLPFDGAYSSRVVVPEGWVAPPGGFPGAARWIAITPGYLEAMSIRLVRGRAFDEGDDERRPRVAIVDERLAQRFWPDRDAIGQRLYTPLDPDDLKTMAEPSHFLTVVGVARTVRLEDLAGDRPTLGAFYYPYAQGRVMPTATMPRTMKFAIKTTVSLDSTARAVRAALSTIDPALPLFDVRSMDELTDLSLAVRKSALTLTIGFGLAALCLATLGIYGVLAYLVGQRGKEFGIRMALGGTMRDVFRLVLREGAMLAGGGLLIGLAANVGLGRLIQQQLYEVQPLDPVVIALVLVTMGTVALLACAIPARRATQVNPAEVLTA
jgi:predicted permease